MRRRKICLLLLTIEILAALWGTVLAAEAEHQHSPSEIWWVDDENLHWQTCTDCGAKILVGEHQWTRRMVETPGTCTTERVEILVCEICQRIIRSITPAPGHSWDQGTVRQEPTCGAEGVMEFRCTACGETKTEGIPCTAHLPGTAWESGAAEHWHLCGSCGVKTDISYHTWTNWITSAGNQQRRQCVICGRMETRKATGIIAPDLVVMSGGVPVQKSFVRDGAAYAVCGEQENLTIQSRSVAFTDVRPGAWYYDVVQFTASHGLLMGVSNTSFAPGDNMTRAMLAAVLYRMEGSPSCGSGYFADVPNGRWYTEAVNWAAEQEILWGTEPGIFEPNACVTREQMVAILYRYARAVGMDMTVRASLSGFVDSGSVSAYAVVPMEWCVAAGLISGRENAAIAPKATATRAEVASVLQRMTVRITEELGTLVS